MVSVLKVDEIQNPSTGQTAIDFDYEFDCFYIDVDAITTGSSTIHQWDRDALTHNSISISGVPVGTGLTGPTGSGDGNDHFSFPRTGLYRIDLDAAYLTNVDQAYITMNFQVSKDNGTSYRELGRVTGSNSTSNFVRGRLGGTFFVNVESVTGSTATRFRVGTEGLATHLGTVQFDGEGGNTFPRYSTLLSSRIAPAVTS